jgi:hypothetical protein
MFYKVQQLNINTGKTCIEFLSGPPNRKQAVSVFKNESKYVTKYFPFEESKITKRVMGDDLYLHVGRIVRIPVTRIIGIHRVIDLIEFKEFLPNEIDQEKRLIHFFLYKTKGILI